MQYPVRSPLQLGQHLKALRKAKGLSQAELGRLIGVQQARIAKIESDPTQISVGQLLKLLALLGAHIAIDTQPGSAASPGDKADW